MILMKSYANKKDQFFNSSALKCDFSDTFLPDLDFYGLVIVRHGSILEGPRTKWLVRINVYWGTEAKYVTYNRIEMQNGLVIAG